MVFAACLASVLAASPAKAQKLPQALLGLKSDPQIDGDLKEYAVAQPFKVPASAIGKSSRLSLKAAFRQSTVYVAVTVTDDKLVPEDQLDLTLYFPNSGTTSKGVVYRFGIEGLRPAPNGMGALPFAQKLISSAVKRTATGYGLEIAIPARALPRFQASQALTLSLCLDSIDVDDGEPEKLTTCPSGEMAFGPTRLPDEFRNHLKLSAPPSVEGIEARSIGWVGYSKLHSIIWAEGDEPLTLQSLSELVSGDEGIAPASVGLPSVSLSLSPQRPIFTLLSGVNPYRKDRCVPTDEVRMAMYLVEGKIAHRVLDWPASNCQLGKAMRVELSDEGSLEIGYTNGATHYFTWSTDHFERSELGLLQQTPVF